MTDKKKTFGMYEIVYVLIVVALLIASVIYMRKPRVGMINFAVAAQELGVASLIEDDIAQRQAVAAAELKKVNTEYLGLSKALKDEFDKAVSDDDKADLKRQMNVTARKYSATVREIKGQVQQYQQKVLFTFKKRLNPYITKVAGKRKLWIVLDNSTRLVYSTSKVDVTDAVVAAARELFDKEESLLDIDDSLISGALTPELPDTDVK